MRASIAVPFALAVLAGSASGFAQSPKDQFVTLQPAGQWLSSPFIGQPVSNDAGGGFLEDAEDVVIGAPGEGGKITLLAGA